MRNITIVFGCGSAYASRQLQKEPRGFSMAEKKIESVRIRVAIVRPHRAASIAERIARVPRIVRLSRATAVMRNVPPGRHWVRRGKRSGLPICGTAADRVLGGGHHSAWRSASFE